MMSSSSRSRLLVSLAAALSFALCGAFGPLLGLDRVGYAGAALAALASAFALLVLLRQQPVEEAESIEAAAVAPAPEPLDKLDARIGERALASITSACRDVCNGDMGSRVAAIEDDAVAAAAQRAVNAALDHCGAIARDALASAEAASSKQPEPDRATEAQQRALERITWACSEIGKGNFEARLVHIEDNGVVGDAQHALNDMLDRCDAFVREASAVMAAVCDNKYYRRILREGLHGSLDVAATTINDATAAIQRRVAAFNADTASFEQAIGTVVDALCQESTDMGDTAKRLKTGATLTRERSVAVAEASNEANADMQAVASATTNLSEAAHQIGEDVGRSTQIAREAVMLSEDATSTMNHLSQAIERVGEVVSLISTIAYQTNLLALNAAIEAAHAGGAGKGFAVVAQEVKALSEQTSHATKEISQFIGEIQKTAKNARAASDGIGKIIGDIDQRTTCIAKAVESQTSATEEIAQCVERAVSGLRSIAGAIEDVTENAGEAERHAETTTAASTNVLEQSQALANDVRDFLVSLKRGPMDNKNAA
jgi:methyl-accepting chemotaxis protein